MRFSNENEPGDAMLGKGREGLAEIPNAKEIREDKKGDTSWGEKLERENENSLLGNRIVQ